MTEPTVHVERILEAPDLPHRLGRHIVHDPRSRAFAFTAAEPRPIVDVAWRRLVPAYDQGDLGSCTAHALCGALSTAPHKHRFRSENNIVKVYSAATAIDPWPGQYKPDDTGSDGLSVAKVALAKGWIREYRHIFSFDDLLQALMVGPVIQGTVWGYDGFHPDADSRVRFTGGIVGGHEYETYGVDVERRLLWHWQSWGSSFGFGGRFCTTWDDQRDALAQQGDATVLVP